MNDNYTKLKETILKIPDQLKQSWDEAKAIVFPANYINFKNIVFCGMGGSALGARIADACLHNSLVIPFEIFNDYTLPSYCDKDTLVIVDSYSGTTEEPVSCLKEALEKELKTVVITEGGELKELAIKFNLPAHILNPLHNPSGQPRNALGYSVGSVFGILASLGLANITDNEINDAVSTMNSFKEDLFAENGLAHEFATTLQDKAVMLISAEHLFGPTYVFKNQLNETAKTFAAIFAIPELNHHLMEGLQFPRQLTKHMTFVTVSSPSFSPRIIKRFQITKEIIKKNGYELLDYKVSSTDNKSQIFEVLMFGAAVVYFLAIYYKVDPSKIPYVDYFKEELAKD